MDLNGTFIREVEVEIQTGESATLSIHQAKVGDVGCVVWDAALVLAYYLQTEKARRNYILNKSIIELGSGTGMVGLVSAACGAKEVTLTDLSEMMPLLQKNIEENKNMLSFKSIEAVVKAAPYKWGSKEDLEHISKGGDFHKDIAHGFDTVLIADCVYYQEAVNPLAQTIADILGNAGGRNVTALCSYEDRDITNKVELQQEFRRILSENFHMKVDFVPHSEMHHEFRSHDIHIFRVVKRT